MPHPRRKTMLVVLAGTALFTACGGNESIPVTAGMGPDPMLPPPDPSLIPVIDIAPAVGWADDATPVAAAGLAVNRFAADLDHPRWLYVLPNGDVLVAETNAPPRPQNATGITGWVMKKVMKRAGASVPSADRITLLRDRDGDGVAEFRSVFLGELHSPFGMELVGSDLYIANTDALLRFPYTPGATSITAAGEKITDLPAGPINRHWTKNVLANRDGSRLLVTVGSNSNIAERGLEAEIDRAAILEVDPATGKKRVFASGLRNPNGLAWHPESNALWTTVNERDGLGDNLVPDYMTTVRDGGFYGWPWSYFGRHVDERVEPARPEKVAEAIVPDYALGAHTASLGLAFYDADLLPTTYKNGAFVGQHGSWNREPPSGYKVIFIPFKGEHPDGMPVDVLTGFVNQDGEAQGRPVGVAVDRTGAVLIADDVGNIVWRIAPR